MNDDLELSRQLTGVVAAVAGVGDIYPSGTLAQTVTLTLANVVSNEAADDAKVAVSRDASGRLSVTATIGVEGGHAAQAVLRSVIDALRAYLATNEPAAEPPAIEVKASRIDVATVIA